jgi:hypothetical protein
VKGQLRSHLVENVSGEIKLAGVPYNGLVLDDKTNTVPLIPVDTAKHLVNWTTCVGRTVTIKELLAVHER